MFRDTERKFQISFLFIRNNNNQPDGHIFYYVDYADLIRLWKINPRTLLCISHNGHAKMGL